MSSVCNRGEGTVPEGGQFRDPRSFGSIGDSGRSERGEHFIAFSGISGQSSAGGPVANQGGWGGGSRRGSKAEAALRSRWCIMWSLLLLLLEAQDGQREEMGSLETEEERGGLTVTGMRSRVLPTLRVWRELQWS